MSRLQLNFTDLSPRMICIKGISYRRIHQSQATSGQFIDTHASSQNLMSFARRDFWEALSDHTPISRGIMPLVGDEGSAAASLSQNKASL